VAFGIFPTFITNTPRTLPDDVFTLLDNLIAFSFRNDDELRQLARLDLSITLLNYQSESFEPGIKKDIS
jgi:hypothetical protein